MRRRSDRGVVHGNTLPHPPVQKMTPSRTLQIFQWPLERDHALNHTVVHEQFGHEPSVAVDDARGFERRLNSV
jgi:hypothetical protein